MDTQEVQKTFRKVVADSIQLHPEGIDRHLVFTPFHFDDGDHFVIILKRNEQGKWIITDEGHTYMHLSYKMDIGSLESGNRNEIIESNLTRYRVSEEKGLIFIELNDPKEAGNVLYNFIQCLLRIVDVSYLSRERVESTFLEDLKNFVQEVITPDRLQSNYTDTTHDPEGKYPVDHRVNGVARPLHLYGINNDAKCRDTTIGILNFEKWEVPFRTMAIFEDQESISRNVLSRLTDVCDWQFSSLAGNEKRIGDYLTKQLT